MKAAPKKEKVEEVEEDIYDKLPGQKHELPDEGDGVLIYYTSLYEQKPESKMSERWLLEHGYFDIDRA